MPVAVQGSGLSDRLLGGPLGLIREFLKGCNRSAQKAQAFLQFRNPSGQPYARRAGGLARARAHALPEGKCEPGPQLHGVNTAEENHRLSFNCRLASMSVVDGSSGVVLSIKNS